MPLFRRHRLRTVEGVLYIWCQHYFRTRMELPYCGAQAKRNKNALTFSWMFRRVRMCGLTCTNPKRRHQISSVIAVHLILTCRMVVQYIPPPPPTETYISCLWHCEKKAILIPTACKRVGLTRRGVLSMLIHGKRE